MADRRAPAGLQAARLLLVLVALGVGVFCVRTGNVVGVVACLAGLGGASFALVQGRALRPQELQSAWWKLRGGLIAIALGTAAVAVVAAVAAVVDG